jgi:hypothetical protein
LITGNQTDQQLLGAGWTQVRHRDLCPACQCKTATIKLELVILDEEYIPSMSKLVDLLSGVVEQLRGYALLPHQELFLDGPESRVGIFALINRDKWMGIKNESTQ